MPTRVETMIVGVAAALALLLFAVAPAAAQPAPAPPPEDLDAEGADQEEEGASEVEEPAARPEHDLEALRSEYFRLRDQLFRSRARAATVASSLYSTRLTIYLHHESGRHWTITRATVRLDGANVFDDTQGAISADQAARFEGFVAPGRHQVSVRLEATARDDDRFASTVDKTFTIHAPAGKDVAVSVRAKDDGDIASSWGRRERGSYDLQLGVRVEAEDRKAGERRRLRRR